jgi:UDP-4-amino-4-deoxy-L-arabinose-oxoglutarate aminotransferase
MKVELFKHNLGTEERILLDKVLNSGFLTTGPRTEEFEASFAGYLDIGYALGFTSWTAAAFLVLKAWGIGPGDEVIVPSMTFISTPNVVLLNGAEVVFCDSEADTGNIDTAKIEGLITPRTKAIIPVHLYGQMADMKSVSSIAKKHGLKVLEDCAHCIEGKREGYGPGMLSDAAAFSFYATKNITSGEGGAVVSNDKDLIENLRLLRMLGMNKSAADRHDNAYIHWDMEMLGFKANMNDLQAALLLPQIARMDSLRTKREELCRYYEDRFRAEGIGFPKVLDGSTSARHIFTIWAGKGRRDEVLAYLQSRGIGVAVNFRAVHILSYYREYLKGKDLDLSIAKSIGDQTVTIPMYPRLTEEEKKYVADTVLEAARETGFTEA